MRKYQIGSVVLLELPFSDTGTIEKVLVNRQLGILQPNDWQLVCQRIQEIWSSI